MENFGSNKMETVLKNLSLLSRDLPFEAEQAWTSSLHHIENYLREHANNGSGLTAKQSAMMATSRLDWLIQESRTKLSNIFNESDIYTLLDCYQGSMFSPCQINCIASDLCDRLGIELEEYEVSNIAPLIEKLLNLSILQRVALADALELTWYRGLGLEKKQPREFLESLGFLLK